MVKTLKFDTIMKKIVRILGIVFLYFFLTVFLGTYYSAMLNSPIEWISKLTEILIYLLIIGIISLLFIPSLVYDFKKFELSNLKKGLSCWIKGLILMIISNTILTNFVIGTIANNESSNRELLLSSPIYSVFLMVILAPILEEMVFRLGIRKQIKNKYVFCIISALFFGFVHILGSERLIELLYIIPYGCLGYYIALAYYETDNIYTSIFTHMFHNFIAIVMIFISVVL